MFKLSSDISDSFSLLKAMEKDLFSSGWTTLCSIRLMLSGLSSWTKDNKHNQSLSMKDIQKEIEIHSNWNIISQRANFNKQTIIQNGISDLQTSLKPACLIFLIISISTSLVSAYINGIFEIEVVIISSRKYFYISSQAYMPSMIGIYMSSIIAV